MGRAGVWLALALVAAVAGGERDERVLTILNALEDGASVDVFYLGLRGRGVWVARSGGAPALDEGSMLCVATDLRAGFEVSTAVGQVGDAYYFRRAVGEGRGERGDSARRPASANASAWYHVEEGDATVFLLPEGAGSLSVVGVHADGAEAFARLAWSDGVGSLFEDADASLAAGDVAGAGDAFSRARSTLAAASLLGDTAAGTLASLAVLAGVLPASGVQNQTAFGLATSAPLADDAPAAVAAIAAVRKNAARGCWLARLAVGGWRTEGRRGLDRKSVV